MILFDVSVKIGEPCSKTLTGNLEKPPVQIKWILLLLPPDYLQIWFVCGISRRILFLNKSSGLQWDLWSQITSPL